MSGRGCIYTVHVSVGEMVQETMRWTMQSLLHTLYAHGAEMGCHLYQDMLQTGRWDMHVPSSRGVR